jgi:hypothetical protein
LEILTDGDQDAIRYLREAVAAGGEWYPALLEAIRRWASPSEDYLGVRQTYLISGEAFDWLRLAARLLAEVRDSVPEEDVTDLLFNGRPPIEYSTTEFRTRIGGSKYQAYLNYLYGVMVEEFLVLAVVDEVRKARLAQGLTDDTGVEDTAFRRVYGVEKSLLLSEFRREKGYPRIRSITLSELDEFAYWRFKYRLVRVEQARLASDTRKALLRMQRQALPPASHGKTSKPGHPVP